MSAIAQCLACNMPATSRCGRCKLANFCSVAHQTLLWPLHKVQCTYDPKLYRQPDMLAEEFDLHKNIMISEYMTAEQANSGHAVFANFQLWTSTLTPKERTDMLISTRTKIHKDSEIPTTSGPTSNSSAITIRLNLATASETYYKARQSLHSFTLLSFVQQHSLDEGSIEMKEPMRGYCNILYSKVAIVFYLILGTREEKDLNQELIQGGYDRVIKYINEVIVTKDSELGGLLLSSFTSLYYQVAKV